MFVTIVKAYAHIVCSLMSLNVKFKEILSKLIMLQAESWTLGHVCSTRGKNFKLVDQIGEKSVSNYGGLCCKSQKSSYHLRAFARQSQYIYCNEYSFDRFSFWVRSSTSPNLYAV